MTQNNYLFRAMINNAWGSDLASLPLSGTDTAECILHELCHAVLLGLAVSYGDCGRLPGLIGTTCDTRYNKPAGDRHEIDTLAAVQLCAQALRVRVAFARRMAKSRRRQLRTACTYNRVKAAAATVVEIVNGRPGTT